MIRGLIFDFDGLILDTESTVYRSWLELYQEYGQDLPFEEWSQIIGISPNEHFDPLERLEILLGCKLDSQELREQRRQRELELVANQPILPGVVEYLLKAREMDLKLGIASSSARDWVGWHLERLGLLEYFDVVHTSDDVQRAKPDPALFRLTLNSLGLISQEVFALEDSPNGVTAAQRAGLFCVVVPNPMTRLLSVDHAELRLDSLADISLEAIIAKVETMKSGDNY
ncbi:MAG: HAD family hydrolase [Chloroflexi bacterium]|nr:HAD family hydrolase [Chloroflexota bacterium]